jgi:hypothetical protein
MSDGCLQLLAMVVVTGTPDNTSSLVWSAWMPRWWRTLFYPQGIFYTISRSLPVNTTAYEQGEGPWHAPYARHQSAPAPRRYPRRTRKAQE